MMIHDFGWPPLPGPKKAAVEFTATHPGEGSAPKLFVEGLGIVVKGGADEQRGD